MAYEGRYSGGKRVITFDPVDFLERAIDEFLASGAESTRIGSAVIMLATGIELLLKEKLAKICPALILPYKTDDAGLQIAKVFRLATKLRNPRELDTVEVKTAAFPSLLVRAAKFFEPVADAEQYLRKLHKIRNGLIHHQEQLDVWEVNLLLTKYIFPFLQEIGKDDRLFKLRLSRETWGQLHEIEEASVDGFTSQLAKKLTHHGRIAKSLSTARVTRLINSTPETITPDESVGEPNLTCPACKQDSLAVFTDIDVDYDESGIVSGNYVFEARCRVCGLDLDQAEFEHIVDAFDQFFGKGKEHEKRFWKQAIEPDVGDYY